MASVYEKNGRWYLRTKGVDGCWRDVASRARTKTEARRLAGELERKQERQRLGLEALPEKDGGGTLAELLEHWLQNYSVGAPAHRSNESVIRKHLIPSDLGKLALAMVSAERVEAFLHAKGQEELGPQSLNHLRGFLSRAFTTARKTGRYTGPNPIARVKKRRIPKRLPEYLRAHEVAPVLAAIDVRSRPLFATAVYTGLRKGELIGLRKADVDLQGRMLSVVRSYERDTTKGGHADAIPLAAELLPYLQKAMDASPSELVFPNEDGEMQRGDVKLAPMLRRALGRAGIVTGYNHVCRGKGCTHAELAADSAPRRCPGDGRKLWPKPQVRQIKFHSLRHTTASLLTMAGASPAAVRRILRWADFKMMDTYAHLAPEYLRAEVDLLSFEPKIPAEPTVEAQAIAASAAPLAAILLLEKREDIASPKPDSNSSVISGLAECAMRESNPRPLAPEAEEGIVQAFPMPINRAVPALEPRPGAVHPSQPVSADTTPFAAGLLLNPGTGRLRSIRGGADRFLTVREVATHLGVSTATVYKLCESGELAHSRVSNAIRISPDALAIFRR